MKNAFTLLNPIKFDKSTIRKIEARRQKDAGTKKETHRGKGGGGSSASNVGNHAIESSGEVKQPESYPRYRSRSSNYNKLFSDAEKRRTKEQIEKRNKRKLIKKTKRVNNGKNKKK